MDRGNSKHGPRLDDEMAHEARGTTQGHPGDARAQEWREPEPAGEDQPAPGAVPHTDAGQMGGSPTGMTPEEREERSRLGRYLRRSAFPADRAALIAEARENQAPDTVVATLRGVPDGVEFQTVAEVWAAYVRVPEDELEQRF
jgi:hypothetical protein